jgi:hypothetical protein
MDYDREELLLLLLREGNRGEAIKLYQEETGAHADEALDAIRGLAASHGLFRHRLPLLPLALALVVLIGGFVVAMSR